MHEWIRNECNTFKPIAKCRHISKPIYLLTWLEYLCKQHTTTATFLKKKKYIFKYPFACTKVEVTIYLYCFKDYTFNKDNFEYVTNLWISKYNSFMSQVTYSRNDSFLAVIDETVPFRNSVDFTVVNVLI